MMTPESESFFHEPEDWIIGVSPLRDHVLRIEGRSEIPDSS
jgi:hypothetical protein